MSFLGAVVGAAIGAGTSIIGANKAEKASKAANAAYLETTKKNAEQQRTWDKETADIRYKSNLEALDLQRSGDLSAFDLKARSLSNLRNQTALSYGQQLSFEFDAGKAQLNRMMETTYAQAKTGAEVALAMYEARTQALNEALAIRTAAGERAAGAARADAAEVKSDLARQADKDIATIRVAAGESGLVGGNIYTRMIGEAAYLEGVSAYRVDRKAEEAIAGIKADLQLAASSTSADLQMATVELDGTLLGISNDLADTNMRAQEFVMEQNNRIQQLALQRLFDLEALDIQAEGLQTEADLSDRQYSLNYKMLDQERDRALELADFVFDQTVTAAEGGASAQNALAAAKADAALFNAAGSFFGNVTSAGFDFLSNYNINKIQNQSLFNQLGTTGRLLTF